MATKQSPKLKMPAWIKISKKKTKPLPMPKDKLKVFCDWILNDSYEGDNDAVVDVLSKIADDDLFMSLGDGGIMEYSVVFQDHNNGRYTFPIFRGLQPDEFDYRPGPWWKEIEGYIDEIMEIECCTDDQIYARYVKVKKLKAFE